VRKDSTAINMGAGQRNQSGHYNYIEHRQNETCIS
jgi:hypothetical protein